MANHWFRFKKFLIRQDRCAMKVGTDGVLLGALANLPRAGRARNGFSSAGQLTGPYRMLDIGTGTGLVALMLAQRSAEQFASGHDVRDRKSTRLNSSHVKISYAVFCLKKKKKYTRITG